jgi:cysteine peptidase C11 family protein/transglutaminase superfamily protein
VVRLLTILALWAALTAAALPRPTAAGPTAPAGLVDAQARRERTERYERAWALSAGPREASDAGARLAAALGRAQAAIGTPPHGWARVRPGLVLAESEREALLAAARDLAVARRLAAEIADEARRHLAAAEALGTLPAAALVRVRAEHALVQERADALAAALDPAGAEVSARADGTPGRAAAWAARLAGRDAATRLAEARARLTAWGVARDPTPIGAELTYVRGALSPAPLPANAVVPAYLAAGASGFALEDTTQGREVELSAAVVAKAAELGTAKAAVDFVRNELRLAWYAGCLKGSTETLREGAGNDADLAALLVALLRAQDVPARFVQGTIELPAARLAELLGLLSAADADALHGGGAFQFAPATRDLALAALSSAGIAFEPVVAAGRVEAVRLAHVWVEAWLPYAEYRGVGTSRAGRQWVPIEPAIPGGAPKYAASEPAVDALAEPGLDAASLTGEVLAGAPAGSPLEVYRARVAERLAARGASYAQALRTVEQRPQLQDFLPGALPYAVRAVHAEGAFLPDDVKHRLRLVARDGPRVLLDATLPLHQLAGHRVIFGYEPASDADAATLAAGGGPFAALAAAVELVPVLRVDGVEKARGAGQVGLGARHALALELLLPGGAVRRVEDEVVAGNVVALGVGAPGNGHAEPAEPDGSDSDGPARVFLYGRAAAYAAAWTRAEEELARLARVVPLWPTANLVLVSYHLDVQEALGVRQRVVWKGVQVDADLRTMAPIELAPGRAAALMRLAGYEGSYQEQRVLADGTGEAAISTVGVLQEAYRTGVPVARIDRANRDAMLPRVSAPADVLRDVVDQVERGREVLVPEAPLTVRDWTGTGFIARDPATEEAGYFLAGRIAGGQTIVSPQGWTDEALAAALGAPDAPRATDDLAAIARIVKVPATDWQEVTVGTPAPQPLAVLVATAKGVPVKGASVTFRSVGVAQPKLGGGAGPVTVRTDEYGRASVPVTPDTNVLVEFVERTPAGGRFPQIYGLNTVLAEVTRDTTTIQLAEPFSVIGLPGPAAYVVRDMYADFTGEPLVEHGTELAVTVVDAYGTPLANQNLVWTQTRSDGGADLGRFVDSWNDARRVRTLDPMSPTQYASMVQVTPSVGKVVGAYIPGPASGLVTFELRATAAADPAAPRPDEPSATFRIHVQPPEAGYVHFGLVSPQAADYHGIYATPHLDSPLAWIGQLLAWTGSGWSPISGREPEYATTLMILDVTDADEVDGGGNNLYHEAVSPDVIGDDPRDDDVTAVFWIPYLVNGGKNHLKFSAEVVRAAETKNRAEGWYKLYAESARATLDAYRRGEGGASALSACGTARASDLSITFTVGNPASYPLVAAITERPRVAGERLLEPPRPELVQRDARGRYLLLQRSNAAITLGLARDAAGKPSSGGTVTLSLLAPDPHAAGGEREVARKEVRIDSETWTVFVYGHGDNDLAYNLVRDLQEMNRAVFDSDRVQVVVAVDWSAGRAPSPDPDFPFVSGEEWFHVLGNGKLPVKDASFPEANFDDPAVLRADVARAFTAYKAEHRAVVLWDHGGSWWGYGTDEMDTTDPADNSTPMSTAQAAAAVAAGLGPAAGKLDLFAFDTCLMAGNEVIYDFRDVAEAYLANAEVDMGYGLDYERFLPLVARQPGLCPLELAKEEVPLWDAHHQRDWTDRLLRAHAAFDLSRVPDYAAAWTKLATALKNAGPTLMPQVARAVYATTPTYGTSYTDDDQQSLRDVQQFARAVKAMPVPAVAEAAADVQTALDDLLVRGVVGEYRSLAGQAGIHLELPAAKQWTVDRAARYRPLAWNVATGWGAALDNLKTNDDGAGPEAHSALANPAADPAHRPVLTLGSASQDAARASVRLVRHDGALRLDYGEIAEQAIDPGRDYDLLWHGKLPTVSDGATTAQVRALVWQGGDGEDAPRLLISPVRIDHTAAGNTKTFLVIEEKNGTASYILDVQGSLFGVNPLKDYAGKALEPKIKDAVTGVFSFGPALTVPASGVLTVTATSAPAGEYDLVTTISDTGGNTTDRTDALHIVAPF